MYMLSGKKRVVKKTKNNVVVEKIEKKLEKKTVQIKDVEKIEKKVDENIVHMKDNMAIPLTYSGTVESAAQKYLMELFPDYGITFDKAVIFNKYGYIQDVFVFKFWKHGMVYDNNPTYIPKTLQCKILYTVTEDDDSNRVLRVLEKDNRVDSGVFSVILSGINDIDLMKKRQLAIEIMGIKDDNIWMKMRQISQICDSIIL